MIFEFACLPQRFYVFEPLNFLRLAVLLQMTDAVTIVALFLHSVMVQTDLLPEHRQPFWDEVRDCDLEHVSGRVETPDILHVAVRER